MFLPYVAVFAFGLVIGSFLNVCIYRIPKGKSIVNPPSSCPGCNSQIKPIHNIPVLSYIMLGGRCDFCGAKISLIYPAIELLNAFAYVMVAARFGFNGQSALIMGLMSVFIVVTFIDLEHKIIPDGITLPGIVLGLLLGPLVFKISFIDSLLGVIIGGGLFFLIAVVSRGGMGGGDIKLIAMMGGFFGWKAVLLTIFLGSAFGAAVGVALMVFKGMHRKTPIPFGPFLVAGAVAAIFWGGGLLEWYGGLHF